MHGVVGAASSFSSAKMLYNMDVYGWSMSRLRLQTGAYKLVPTQAELVELLMMQEVFSTFIFLTSTSRKESNLSN